jgi:toxin-antitoxin system PIN domain toxin
MLSIDTNILLAALEESNPLHKRAAAFVESLGEREDVVISELMLVELYGLLRNPAVVPTPRSAAAAVEICRELRNHPRWTLLGLPPWGRAFHDAFWAGLTDPAFARRRAYDWRMALALIQQGVDEFATANTRDFAGFGFRRVWNPLAEEL